MQLYRNISQGIGTINWEQNLKLQEKAIPRMIIFPNGDRIANLCYQGEVFFMNKINKAILLNLGINNVKCKVDLHNADELILNQNYYRGWVCDKGKVKSSNGLISVQLQQIGEYEVNFSFRPISFYLGLMVSIITLILLLIYGKIIFVSWIKTN